MLQMGMAPGGVTMRPRETVKPPEIMTLGVRVPADVKGWLVSEKLDGIFARWDGSRFVTRGGQVLDAPHRLSRGLGSKVVDGELWAGRGEFGVVSAAHLMPSDSERWSRIDFYPFDAEGPGGYKERTKWLSRRLVKTSVLRGADDLAERLEAVRKVGGEGLVIRNPDAPYETCRSRHAIKVKCKTQVESRVKAVNGDYAVLESGVTFKCPGCHEGETIRYEITGWGPNGQRGARQL